MSKIAGAAFLAGLLASCASPRTILDSGSRAERDNLNRWAEVQYNKALVAADKKLATTPEDADAIEVKGIAGRKLAQIHEDRGEKKEAYAALEASAAAGYSSSLSRLAQLHSDGVYVPRNIPAVVPGYAKLAEEDKSIRASLLLADLAQQGKLRGSGLNTDPSYWYAKASSIGSVKAKDSLARLYAARGRLNEAKQLLASQGRTKALGKYLTLAKDTLDGRDGVRKNLNAGVFWLNAAAEINAERASSVAVSFYRKTESETERAAVLPFMLSVPSARINDLIADYETLSNETTKREVFAQIRSAADEGNGKAALLVARVLRGNSNSIGDEALRYYGIAAANGQQGAVRLLVDQASFGSVGNPATDRIVKTLTDVANGGDVDAAIALARFYQLGGPTPKDPQKSFAWNKKAADAGNQEAQFNTGVALAEGTGTAKDIAAARRYLTAAADGGNSAAKAYLQSLPAE
ncbi:tetratricopeptide repeat protein [Roseibium sp. M-1]